MSTAIFTDWAETSSASWGQRPIRLSHRLHELPLLSRHALGRLVDRTPRERYSLAKMSAPGAHPAWHEGEIGGVPGEDVIAAIAQGRMRLTVSDIDEIDPGFREVVDAIFGELAGRVPGLPPADQRCGIMISSPSAGLEYCAGFPGGQLWQLIGRTRIYIYPAQPPFVTPEHLEDVALLGSEASVPYAPWYDDHADIHDLEPGQMLSWPATSPYRLESVGALNVAMTVSSTTADARRRTAVYRANALLRHRFGISARSRRIVGLEYYAKAALGRALRHGGSTVRKGGGDQAAEFRLEVGRPGGIVDRAAAAR